jgi:ubiquinone/menaquinone biosynthesis C-methylase UbiE
VHAAGADLAAAARRVRGLTPAPREALDVGCGAGHLSFALAPQVQRIIAVDPSASMLATVRGAAAERGLTTLETAQGQAEHLPFPDARFDLVCTRYEATGMLRPASELRNEVERERLREVKVQF